MQKDNKNIVKNSELITEKKYPIPLIWIFIMPFFIFLPLVVVYFVHDFFDDFLTYFFSIVCLVVLIINYLNRKNFHYSVEKKNFVVKKWNSLESQRYLPYSAINNIFIKQNLLDKILGLSLIKIEIKPEGDKKNFNNKRSTSELNGAKEVEGEGNAIVFSKSKIIIPCLKKEDAEALKNVILQKMKENQIKDSQLGL